MNYGLPYKGSKNLIAKDIVDFLPSGETFVDLFCGGCAVTHAAMLSGKFKRFIINDVDQLMPKFFTDAVNGKYKDERRVIDRETFHQLKHSDPYVRFCWSFGTNGETYLWNEQKEVANLIACKLIMSNDWQERRLLFVEFIKYLQKNPEWMKEYIMNVRRVEPFERLARILRLQELNCSDNLQSYSMDYQDVPIPEGVVVYCAPPYAGTYGYTNVHKCDFDSERFYKWLRTREYPVYVSEYAMPDDFICIWSKEKRVCYASVNNKGKRLEKLFVHKNFIDSVPKHELF